MAITTKSRKEMLQRAWEEAFAGDFDQLRELYADDVVAIDPTTELQGLDAYIEYSKEFVNAFPDFQFEIHEMIAEDDTLVTYTTSSGTHEGNFGDVPPTGNRMEVDGVTIDWFDDEGRIVKEVNLWDNLSVLQQLGVDPSTL